jgi:FixJ family two-component response regulator
VRTPNAVRMLFTGFADIDSIIAAINQGHVFQFIKKPWQPEELLQAVRMAAAEYDWLVKTAGENQRLQEEIQSLHNRVSTIEAELQRIGKLAPPAGSSS